MSGVLQTERSAAPCGREVGGGRAGQLDAVKTADLTAVLIRRFQGWFRFDRKRWHKHISDLVYDIWQTQKSFLAILLAPLSG